MKKIWNCRRSMLALIGMVLLTAMSFINKIDTSGAIATIVLAVAAANGAESAYKSKNSKEG